MSDRTGGHSAVLASAGSGKTFLLTSRLIAHLSAGGDPGAILATTFTRKAAGEICQRVLERLCRAADDDLALAELCRACDIDLSRGACLRLIGSLASSLDRLNIRTIDSLLAGLARAFSLELGVSPEWTLADEATDAAMRSRAAVEALEAIAGTDPGQLDTLLRALHPAEGGRKVHEALLAAVSQGYNALLETLDQPEVWSIGGGRAEPGDDEVESLARAIEAAAVPTTRRGGPNQHWETARRKLVEALRRRDWKAVAGGKLLPTVCAEREYHKCSAPEDLRLACARLGEVVVGVLRQEVDRRTRAIRRLLEEFHRTYFEIKRRSGLYRFEDVPGMLLADRVTHRLPEVYERLDASIDHLLLDEFQDTSVTQFALLAPIIDELVSGGEGRSVLCVGDAKQSLYAWRNAEPELLPELPRRWPQIRSRSLARNYRSSPVVLEAVNRVFRSLGALEPIAGEENAEIAAAASRFSDMFEPHAAEHESRPGSVRLIECDDAGADADRSDRRYEALRLAAERAAQIRRASPGASIAILFRARRDIRRMIGLLRREGIEASEEGGSALTDSPAVAAAVSLLRLAEHPEEQVAAVYGWAGPMRSAMPGDPRHRQNRLAASARLRALFDSEGYARSFERLRRSCADPLDAASIERLDRLIDLAQRADDGPPMSPGRLADLIEREHVETPGASSAVRVMTIHKSKGLEFDAVVLPDLDSPWKKASRRVLLSRPSPLEAPDLVCAAPSTELCSLDAPLRSLVHRAQAREVSEELCCLYVAMTRAVHSLDLIVQPVAPRTPKFSAARVLRAALAREPGDTEGRVLFRLGDESPEGLGWTRDPRLSRHGAAAAARPGTTAPPAGHEMFDSARGISLVSRRAGARPTWRLPRQSPSGLSHGVSADLGEMLRREPRASLELGTIVHGMLERVGWLDESAPSAELLLEWARELGAAGSLAADASRQVGAILLGPCAAVLRREYYADDLKTGRRLDLRREWPFARRTADETPALLTGVIDRLVVVQGPDGPERAHVVDFKTDRLDAGDAPRLAARIEHYRPQMEAYRSAVCGVFGLAPGAVRSTLLLLVPGLVTDLQGTGAI